MNIGLVDVDGHNFPNFALMRLSACYKAKGHRVEWAAPRQRYDKVLASKVFTFTPDYDYDLLDVGECNLQIFLCLFLEKLNMPQNTPVTKAS